jgi:hypothetical protein
VTAAAARPGPVHIRPGDDLRARLPAAGVAGGGAYLCVADPVCVGPAREEGGLEGWVLRRARFVAGHAGVPEAEARARLGREYTALLDLGRDDAPPAWLWFEHDLWDQAALLRVLSLLPTKPIDRLLLVPADGRRVFPELGDAELAALRPVPLAEAQREAAAAAWRGFTDPDPRGLDALARQDLPLPFLAAAMRRHLMDLPWTTDGLALTERRALRAVAEGASGRREVFGILRAGDPVFHVTDLIVREVLRRLQDGLPPLLEPGEAPLRTTARGAVVLAGRARHRPSPRDHAGVRILPDPPWLWDPDRDGVVPG